MRKKKKKKKTDYHVSASSLNNTPSDNKSLFPLSSFEDDEPVLAEEEGGSADCRTTEDGYETNNFLIHVRAGMARNQIMANCHCVHFKVITR